MKYETKEGRSGGQSTQLMERVGDGQKELLSELGGGVEKVT